MAENKALRPDGLELLTQFLYGDPVLLGTIAATTTKNNNDTAVPFSNTGNGLAGKVLLLQADAACYVITGTANTVTSSATTGVYLAALDPRIIVPKSLNGWLACFPLGASVNLRVFEMT